MFKSLLCSPRQLPAAKPVRRPNNFRTISPSSQWELLRNDDGGDGDDGDGGYDGDDDGDDGGWTT